MGFLVRSLWLAVLLAQRCGAWVSTTSPLRLLFSSGQAKGLRPAAFVVANARCPFSRTVPTFGPHERRPSVPLRAEPTKTESPEVSNPSAGAGETNSSKDKGVEVTARLHKPVGLMLAETEPGKPGLIVDELVEGGSAEVRCMVRARG